MQPQSIKISFCEVHLVVSMVVDVAQQDEQLVFLLAFLLVTMKLLLHHKSDRTKKERQIKQQNHQQMLEVSNINDEPHDEYRGNTCMICFLGRNLLGEIFFAGLQQTFYLEYITTLKLCNVIQLCLHLLYPGC